MRSLYSVLIVSLLFSMPGFAADKAENQQVPQDLLADAEAGDAGAQLLLGHMYANGQGGAPQDFAEAVKWFTRAAEQGSGDAQFMLGSMYAEGRGVTQDYQRAVKWYAMAAEQGNVEIQIMLGIMYAEGQNVAQDLNKAIKWFNMAAAQGNTQAQQYLQQIFAAMRENAAQQPPAQPMPAADPNEISISKYAFNVDGFAAVFPFEPVKTVVQDNSRIRAIQYQAASRDGRIQYNVSLQQFKGEQMQDREARKKFLDDYIAGRVMFAWKNRIQKQNLSFMNSQAVQFRHTTYLGRNEMIHEGIKFFSGNDSITLTCIYPVGATVPISFEQFRDSFELLKEKKNEE